MLIRANNLNLSVQWVRRSWFRAEDKDYRRHADVHVSSMYVRAKRGKRIFFSL